MNTTYQNSSLLADLNQPQQQAVTAKPTENLLVLAGPGCGKTRTLTYRIAWLIQQQLISAHGVLAVTFTNKSANEMRTRLHQLLGQQASAMWISTFHGFGHRFLKKHYEEASLNENFQILDADDQLRLIKRIHKTMQLDDAKYPPKKSQAFINRHKQLGQYPQDISPEDHHPTQRQLQQVYHQYLTLCQNSNLIDFADLLLKTYETLKKKPDLLTYYQERFQCIFIDEFQDTNAIQYQLIQLLFSGKNAITVVCDEDQSVYGWRGAQVEHIFKFEKDFPATRLIRLEQNYRSTPIILKAANSLIGHNENRLGKQLWTTDQEGEKILYFTAFNEIDEARFIVEQIQTLKKEGVNYRHIALLYRSNAQSRPLEEALRGMQIPYQIYGGHKFFERAEIKDALSYLRLAVNPQDDAAFERVVNTPARGIGHATLNALRNYARSYQTSLWDALQTALTQNQLGTRGLNSLRHFQETILSIQEKTQDTSLPESTALIMKMSGLLDHFKQDKTEKGQSRLENIQELMTATQQFCVSPQDSGKIQMNAFLAHVTLEAGESPEESDDTHPKDSLQLMTIHAAKGLEFPHVFLTGLEEGLFPHRMSLYEPGRLEEERRLFYVGMTRAMKRLYLTHAETRRLHGSELHQSPSRFLSEIPNEYLQPVRLYSTKKPQHQSTHSYHWNNQLSYAIEKTNQKSTPPPIAANYLTQKQAADNHYPFPIGQRIRHPKFKEGIILSYEGRGDYARIQVQFKSWGIKWLVASYANLEPY